MHVVQFSPGRGLPFWLARRARISDGSGAAGWAGSTRMARHAPHPEPVGGVWREPGNGSEAAEARGWSPAGEEAATSYQAGHRPPEARPAASHLRLARAPRVGRRRRHAV
jgi:hypothetical protein